MRWERFLKKRKSISLCRRKISFFSDSISSCCPHYFFCLTYPDCLTPLENCLLQIVGTQFSSWLGLPIRGQISLKLVHCAQVLAAKVLQGRNITASPTPSHFPQVSLLLVACLLPPLHYWNFSCKYHHSSFHCKLCACPPKLPAT